MWSWNRTGSRGAYLVAYIHDHPHADKRGRIYLHRAIMENHLGRMLARTELVHHKDRDPRNNEVDNLEVMSVLEHNVEHHSGREDLILECGWCGVKVVRRHGQRNGQNVFCSRSHSAMFYGRGVAERHDYGAYRRGCRCQVCREANAARIRSHETLIAETWVAGAHGASYASAMTDYKVAVEEVELADEAEPCWQFRTCFSVGVQGFDLVRALAEDEQERVETRAHCQFIAEQFEGALKKVIQSTTLSKEALRLGAYVEDCAAKGIDVDHKGLLMALVRHARAQEAS